MHPVAQTLLTQLVVTAGLIGATIEYAEIVKRRARLRLQAAESASFQDEGRRGVVLVLAQAEPPAKPPRLRWRHFALDRRRRRVLRHLPR